MEGHRLSSGEDFSYLEYMLKRFPFDFQIFFTMIEWLQSFLIVWYNVTFAQLSVANLKSIDTLSQVGPVSYLRFLYHSGLFVIAFLICSLFSGLICIALKQSAP